ncbi:MAG TPA: GNAT family N-acetyltransferase [Acidimicrobiia bacterium]|nr:GNAT family N-acetyltransferase [Acidimicrobiia bacterium]
MTASKPGAETGEFKVAHLTTVDLSLRFLVRPQLLAVIDEGGEAVGVSAPGPWVEELERDGIRHVPLTASTRGMSLGNDFKAMLQFWRVLREERFTVLHTHNPKPGVYGRILGRLAGVPLVVNTMHGLYATEDDAPLKRAVVYSLEAVAARFSDAELHQNSEDLEFCTRTRILPPGRGRLLGNGVNLERFDREKVDPEARSRLRAEFGAGEEDVVVGMVGRLVAEKGYPELFEAATTLGEGYIVVAVGPDDPEKSDALPEGAVANATAAGVRFLGMRTDMEDLYSAMDLFVLPSHREGFPRAAMEAAAMGLPVVATDIRGCRQVVEDGVNGFLVPVRDPEALAGAISKLGEDGELREKMSSASAQVARVRFDEQEVVRIVMDTYREGLMKKGLGHLMPSAMIESPPRLQMREGEPRDARTLAQLHATEIATGFLPLLGRGFMKVLYSALISWKDAVVLLIEDGGGPVAFTVGVKDVGEFYRHFSRRHGWRAGLAALPRLVRPSNFRMAWETFRYGNAKVEVPAELLSMVVAPRARGRGLSLMLGARLLDEMAERGAAAVKVVVGSENQTALGAYRKMGFMDTERIQVHSGESSEVLVWRP